MSRKNRKSHGVGLKLALLVAVGVAFYSMSTPTARNSRPASTVAATATPRPATVRPSAVTSLAQSAGYSLSVSEDSGPVRCDYTLDNTKSATVVWTDGVQSYSISGEPNDLGLLYMKMLELDDRKSCQYYVTRHPRCGYGNGVKVSDPSQTIGDYIAAFRDLSGVKPTPEPTPVKYQYVLNNESRIFHWPDCYQASRIKGKKRQVVTTTREKLIKAGYSPCGNCNP